MAAAHMESAAGRSVAPVGDIPVAEDKGTPGLAGHTESAESETGQAVHMGP